MTTFGNSLPQAETRAAILEVPRFLVLSGPENVGKLSFVKAVLESVLDESDLMVAEPGPDGARAARPFLADMPAFSPFRAVLVDDMDFLSEPAQDSWLKLCEETPGRSSVIAVASDPSLLLPPLLSRVVRDVRWSPLSETEMSDYSASTEREFDRAASRLCGGRPGLYETMCSPGYVGLFESVVDLVSGPSLEPRVPSVVKDLESGRSLGRTCVSLVVRRAALSLASDPGTRVSALSFLRFAADIVRVPSINAEIHWHNAVMSSLKL